MNWNLIIPIEDTKRDYLLKYTLERIRPLTHIVDIFNALKCVLKDLASNKVITHLPMHD